MGGVACIRLLRRCQHSPHGAETQVIFSGLALPAVHVPPCHLGYRPLLQAVTGTRDGDIILWDKASAGTGPDAAPALKKRAAKVIRIHSSCISHLSIVDKFLVSGAADGCVRFFDAKLRLAAWFEVGRSGIWLRLCIHGRLPAWLVALIIVYNLYPCTPVLVYMLDNCMHELAGSLIIWLTSHLRRASKQLKPVSP